MPSRVSGWLPSLGWRGWLAGGLAVLVVGVLVVARLVGADNTARDRRESPTDSYGASRGPDDGLVGSATLQPTAPPVEAAQVAYDFVRAWASRHRPASQWWRQVAAYADPAFAAQLRQTDPSRVPASKVEGGLEDIKVRAASESSVVLLVPTDAGRVVVSCVLVEGQWRVIDLDIELGAKPKGQPS